MQKPENKLILKRKNSWKTWSVIKTYCKAIVIKSVRIEQINNNRIRSPEIDLNMLSVVDQGAKLIQWEKESLDNTISGTTEYRIT